MKAVKAQDAVGQILCHDITRIVPGEFKGPVFRKGHIITEEDIPVLLSVGKETVYIWENDDTVYHENDAAEILLSMCGSTNMTYSEPKEGKIELRAAVDGLFLVDDERLKKVNSLGDMMIATIHGGFTVNKGDKLAGMRVIPLVIKKDRMNLAKELAGDESLLKLVPLKQKSFAVITTGSEVFHHRIEDGFTPVLEAKLAEFGCKMIFHEILDDDPKGITATIKRALDTGAEMVLCTGGMSVDPDDKTPLAIKESGADIITYGSPVLPGAMFLVSYSSEGVPVIGLPGCVMYEKRTVFDLVLPRLLADVPVTKEYIYSLGNGGLCMGCAECTFPKCGFGK